jgi:ankyrin repeat protein
MPLIGLPTELLLEICYSLQPAHILNLVYVNHLFCSVFLPLLYKINVLRWKSSALIWGARHNACHVVQRILDHHNADINTRDPNSRTAIFYAVKNQDQVILDITLNDSRTNVNCQDRYGQTPLLYALSSRRSSMAYQLVKHHDISVTAEDRKGRTALWYAIATKEEHLIQQLLQKGSSTIDIQDIRWYSPLSVAVYQGNLTLVKQLLSYTVQHGQHVRGCSSTTADPDEAIPLLCLAIQKRRWKIAHLLLSINYVTATEYLEIGQSMQRNQKGRN